MSGLESYLEGSGQLYVEDWQVRFLAEAHGAEVTIQSDGKEIEVESLPSYMGMLLKLFALR